MNAYIFPNYPFCLLDDKKEDYLIIEGHLHALQKSQPSRNKSLFYQIVKNTACGRNQHQEESGMGSALAVLPTKITRGMFLSFFPSVIALLAVVMNINSSEEGTEGSIGLPLTLIRHDVAKTRSSTSVLMKLHGMWLHCKQ